MRWAQSVASVSGPSTPESKGTPARTCSNLGIPICESLIDVITRSNESCPPADRRSRSPHLLTAEPIRGSAEKPKPRRTSRAARARAPLRRGDSQRHGAAYAFLPARRTATSPSRGGVVRPKGGVPGPEKASMLIRRGVLRPTPRRCSSARSCDVRRRAASPRRTNGEGTAAEEPAASQSPEASWIEVSP